MPQGRTSAPPVARMEVWPVTASSFKTVASESVKSTSPEFTPGVDEPAPRWLGGGVAQTLSVPRRSTAHRTEPAAALGGGTVTGPLVSSVGVFARPESILQKSFILVRYDSGVRFLQRFARILYSGRRRRGGGLTRSVALRWGRGVRLCAQDKIQRRSQPSR